ncbi:dynein heavy chain 5, axonemal-like [Polypterus senegalus]|nr:dynein heavy chain 5, axonemal-like [Polypterus senegalus]
MADAVERYRRYDRYTPGKKTTVLSNETRKEMVKQAKATKDERRAQLDARHRYLISLLSHGIGLTEADVEEFIVSDDKFGAIEDFFAANGTKKMTFFYQEISQGNSRKQSVPSWVESSSSSPNQKKLFISTGGEEELTGLCAFFLRTMEKSITPQNILQEVYFGILNCSGGSLLHSLEEFLSHIMVPALKSQENWGAVKEGPKNMQIQEFFSSVEKFTGSLASARENIEEKFQLQTYDTGYNLETLQNPSDYMAAASNSEMVDKLEGLLLQWAKQIEQVLTESEQMRKEADDIGPSAELEHWKKRMATFNSLLDEIKSPHVKKVVGVLQVAKSRTLKHWKQLDISITSAANEAKDNVKYLYTLDRFFGPLGKCTPTSMLEHIPSLINSIRMIYSISQYYNTSERMTSLFVKITNQMISTCKAYLYQGVNKIWEHDRNELLKRIQDCTQLNKEYQETFHRVKEKLRESQNERQFEFSENYIFGKFDTFCKRLEKIAYMINTIENLSDLQNVKLEGIEKICIRYQTIVTTTKSKNYDVLDLRKPEFDNDYTEFQYQIQSLYQSLQSYVDSWFEQPLTTERMLELLAKFERIAGDQLDLTEKYLMVLQRYGRDLELVRKLYQKQKDNPPTPRNIPPVAGKIMWARQLFRKIDGPMKILKHKPDILKVAEMKKIIRNYNKVAAVLLEFELLYHRGWCQAVELGRQGLNVSLLVRHHETRELFVNFDPIILRVLYEAKYLYKMGLEVPELVVSMCSHEEQIKDLHIKLQEMLNHYQSVLNRIPSMVHPLMQPFVARVEEALSPGLTMLSWSSLNTDKFIENVYSCLQELEQIVKEMSDILECRIDNVFQAMSSTVLLDLPEDEPMEMHAFYEMTEKVVALAAETLATQSQQVERSMLEMINNLKNRMKPDDKVNLQDSYQCLHPDTKQKTRCQECLPCCFYNMMGQLCQKNTDAFVKSTKLSLDALKRRLHVVSSKYLAASPSMKMSIQPPLFQASIQLVIPNVVMRPSLEEIQNTINKAVVTMLTMAKNIPLWTFAHLHHKQLQIEQNAARDLGDDSKLTKQIVLKTLDKQLSEHKDISKVVIQLNSIVSSLKADAVDVLDNFSQFSSLWNQEPNDKVKEFVQTNPSLSEFSAHISSYTKLETQINDLPQFYTLGSVQLQTEPLKLALTQECRHWKRAFGVSLNKKASSDMEEIYTFIDALSKRLHRPIKDLEDVRDAMAALREIRDAEIRIDMTITPVEESYSLLNKHELLFQDGNTERVDGLAYAWKNLNAQVLQSQNFLVKIQPSMKADLLAGVQSFQTEVQSFYTGYDQRGPGVEGIPPREASDRLQIFQTQFDELWRKYVTYSGGEELFGLPVKEYSDLQRIKRELALLQKLYSLYNSVIESVNGYYDILWSDLEIDKINNELTDFQNRIRKLPKALKEWQAFNDLKKTIDDFSETCPLLEMMANKAMMARHWERISQFTGYVFDVESEHFALRNIMEAPLLKYKEDIEDICISAVKEKDIEAKLKGVINEWSAHVFTFAQFKTRGELLLKGSDTSEKVSLMEDSLMVLASLMSNRYNAPFKPTIQQWVQKLSNTTEIIENWLTVQNLWIYLEAVFVGGDIAKQLPQEAKRFQNIDKSWQKIMQRAHEIPNIVHCCVGDETLAQLLPHLLEQLEMCQKSLTGYLEKKRLVFPRFFFVSDPALLEILGQASDSHTIQAHLLSLFDNVNRVGFHDKNYDQILNFQSQEGEIVNFTEPIMAQGNVEAWLGLVLDGVKKTIHSIIKQAYLAISDPGMKLYEFQAMFPAQIGLLGIQMIWTRDSEEALMNAKVDKKVMQTTNQKFLDILNDLIDMTTQDLTKMDRTKYETLITIHVHQKDIFDDLVRMNIRSTSDFEWQKQSRFYFIEDLDKCAIQITDVEFTYCNEYLGCTDRLVITPLTDRCYITLAQALGMSMGGAPAGPAGTGKTETTKDMGRCLGKYVVVFNCSDQMDYRGLGRIYKGLAQAGAWGCFDEFNRIELPVLSVAAQQIYIVLQCKKNKKPQFIFTDGDVVDMDREFGIFLTMNPGYAGRQELPENLKIQFRTVAMMVPDRAIIMRVKLASAGFRDNLILSRKFYTLYKLCEEQLSKQDLFNFVSTAVTPKMQILECMYIKQAIELLQGLLPAAEEKQPSAEHVGRLFIFAIMWSIGALLELEDRVKMENFLRSHTAKLELPVTTGEQTIFEFVVNESGQWDHWSKKVPEYIYPKDSIPEYASILVPNVDNVRTDFLMHTIMKQGKAVLLIGEQGTAKTVMIKGYMSKYDPEVHLTKSLNFSSATLPNMFQRSIESYIDKRMGTTYGPPAGKKMTVFVDDINMPVINEWGDQITNEIVRQLMEQKGFYNLDKPGEFTGIVDIQFAAAMIHPGGGRNDIPQRLKRQFTVYNCTLPSNSSIDKIFSTIAEGYFCEQRGFPKEVCNLAAALVPSTRRIWQATKIKMLPTPAKFHYIFNLRDLSRIWQGILKVTSEVCQTTDVLVALFLHECSRVIADRFTNHKDKEWFEQCMQKISAEDHGPNIIDTAPKEAYFVDFLRDAPEATGDEPEDAELEAPKIYEPIPSFEKLSERLEMFMQQYNEAIRGTHMDLVCFKDAMVHLVKISRVIRTPQGNALLVGVGGSGKQSLTRLASFIAGYQSFQITLTRTYNTGNLMDDLKQLYRTAGQKGKGITFIFTDNEIKDESFLEYMNNVLASGEVSNLFARDEVDEITQDLIAVMKKEYPRRVPTPENLYDYFLSRVRSNLHVVLCFSPVGEKFRTRALKFPGLISGCTMDWFQRWPKDALVAVAQHFLSSYKIECSDEVKQNVVNTMGTFQDLVAEKCVEYFERYRRQTYVTPKSYLSFIGGYKIIYSEKIAYVGMLAERMRTGLAKLMEAEVSVNQLSKELAVKEADLAVASKKADGVLQEVTVKAQAAEAVKSQVQKVKDKAQAIVDEIEADKAVAEGKLEAARPALELAEAALQTIKPADIATVRKLGKPPHLIMRIMDCVLLLFQRRVDTVTMDPERPCNKPSWAEALKLMNNSGFLNMLLTFQKDTITEEVVELLTPYLEMEDYNLETAKKVCGNVAGLCSWTQAMAYFFGINKEVLPLKANLKLQEARLTVAQTELSNAQMQLDEKQKELDEVQAMYNAAMSEKQTLLDDAEACRKKMSNATALIEGLGGEKVRWTQSSKLFQSQINRLVGDVLLATGFLSYSGPFNQEYRNLLLKLWKKEMSTNRIPYSDDLNLINMLVDNATIGEWNLQGLPNDDLSIQNGIIVTKASRYPLLIDPQGQGKIWIKSREKNNDLQVTSLNHKYFRSHLEDTLSLGRPLLIEDVGEELDPALDNVLEKNFIKSGSTFKVKVGDKEIDVMKGFTLYITTKLANPAYTPEISAKTAVIDFTVTMKGLEDQLLGRVIQTEKQELEADRVKLLEEVTLNKRKMQELEDNLLYRLTSTQGSLVEDDSLIEVLRITKSTAEEVSEKLNVAAETEIKINSAREEYRPVATRGSILYFLIVEMSLVNVMYQTSLRQFLGLFDISMEKSVKSQITSKRIANIIEYLTYEVFKYTARGLYEDHKFLFTLLMALKIDLQAKKISHDEFQTLIKGGASLDLNSVEPKPKKWILDMTWLNLVQLSHIYPFTQLLSNVAKNDKGWKQWFDEEAPEEATIPDGYDNQLDTFRKLLLIRSWSPDRTIAQARHYIAESLGTRYAEGVILDMDGMWAESDSQTPMICFLSMGSDPTENIERLAKTKNTPCRAISMGQGQEVHARRLLNQSMQDGGWLLLQNCHLGLDFLDELLDTITTAETMHEGCRTWITTEVHPKFPINLLQSSIKFTNEPPQGVKAGLKRTYTSISQELLDISNMPQWKPLLYSVAFLHTTVQERRKFGPLGWNIPYEFNQADFTASVQFVQNHLDEMDIKRGVNWSCVRYMLGEVQYGGRVTDDLDKHLLNTFSRVWFGENTFSDKFCFYKGYAIPKGKTIQDYLQHIELLPLVDTPEVFGLHPNADITYQTNMANETLSTIVNIQPKDSGGGGGETREATVQRLADEMLEKLPPDYVPYEVKARLQKMGPIQPMNIFLRQEIDRMQRIITRVRNTLTDLKLAIDGTIIMSEDLRDALDNMYDARIPKLWYKISWESATLGFWFTELLERNQQFHTWLFEGRPNQFWMTGFFNPQGFLTAMHQETTRMNISKGWALDSVILYNDVTRMMKEDVTGPPPADIGGVYIYGLFLDGAGWDRRNTKLMESSPKVLFTSLPVVHVYAISTTAPSDPKKQQGNLYSCPVYKKPRRTDLTYIFSLYLKTTQAADHWTLRGVALLCDSK